MKLSQRFVWFLTLLAVLAAGIQLAIGASPVVVALALLSAASGLLAFVSVGATNVGAWIALFYALGNVLVALYAKTVLLQPLDTNLYTPFTSFLVLAVSGTGLLVALMVAERVEVGRPLFAPTHDRGFLAFLSWSCFALAIVFWFLNRSYEDPVEGGFGGFAVFHDLLLMAIIARTAICAQRDQAVKQDTRLLFVLVGVSVLLGLLDNSKSKAALPVVTAIATWLFYGRKVPTRVLLVAASAGIVFVTLISPAIHALRVLGQQEMSIADRVDFLVSNVGVVVDNPETLEMFERIAAGEFDDGYYNYFGDNGTGQMLVGRYASVQQIDPVIAEVDQRGTQGGDALWPALIRQLPSVIAPDKPEFGEAYHTLVHYGLVDPSGGKNPTLPLAGQAYAAYGLSGAALVPLCTFFLFLLVLKKLGWNLYRNVYAIFFWCVFVVVYAGQGDFSQYVSAALRNFPLFAIIFWALNYAWRYQQRNAPSVH